ncbi:MAG: FecR domain-containing protein [bacterium]
MTSPSDDTLARYLRKECSRAEVVQIDAWLRDDPANAGELAAVARLLSPPTMPRDWGVDSMWQRVRIEAIESGRPSPVLHGTSMNVRAGAGGASARRVSAAVAAAALVGIAAMTARELRTSRPQAVPAQTAAPRQYLTRRGERAIIELADGTRVTLAPETRLVIPDDYGSRNRFVTLSGEAIFTVVHNREAPFQVRTASVTFTDIGTRFDVRAYDADARVAVAVAEGTVSLTRPVRDAMAPVFLTRGQLAVVEPDGAVRQGRIARVSSYFGWSEGQLAFDDEPVGSVLRTIARWYDLDIALVDEGLATRRVTVDFSTGSAGAMIDALGAALNVPVTRNGRHVTIGTRGKRS